MARGARKAGVKRIVAASFTDETSDRLAPEVDDIEWLRAGQLGKLLTYLEKSGTRHAVMAGQIAPKNLFDLRCGHDIAKEVSRLDIGQTVLVKNGTVLAVEGFEGTNECIKRGGALARGDAVMVKVSKPDQDLRFDVPVIGPVTLESCRDAGGIEAGRTITLERDRVAALATQHKLSIFGL